MTIEVNDLGNSGVGGPLTASHSITLSINAKNDNPVGADKAVQMDEDSTYTFRLSDFAFSDPKDEPNPNQFTGIRIDAAPTAGTLKLNGTVLTGGEIVSKTTSSAASCASTRMPIATATPTRPFPFRVQDDGPSYGSGANTDSSPRRVTFDVLPVNDRPSFFAVDPPTSLEDQGVVTVIGWATVLKGGWNEDSQAITFHVTAANPSFFSQQPTVDATGTLRYKVAPDVFGQTTFTVVVDDDGGTDRGGEDESAFGTFALNVTPVNDAPYLIGADDISVNEDAGQVTIEDFASSVVGPTNEDGQVATMKVVALTKPELFAIAHARRLRELDVQVQAGRQWRGDVPHSDQGRRRHRERRRKHRALKTRDPDDQTG
ncbi:MAG: Ig-like domain-containing protein [Gemmataceae bacterium]